MTQTRTAATPGPWHISDLDPLVIGPRRIVQAHNTPVPQLQAVARVYDRATETEANARLIAEAPALAEALRGLFEHCAMVHKHWGDGNNQKQADAAIEAARALLARIDGQ